MKKLLFFLSAIFLLLCTSCQEKNLVAEGKLTQLSETSATIDGITYNVENGTTDYLFGDKMTADGKNASIYKDDGKLYVSKLNQEHLNDFAVNDFAGANLGWRVIAGVSGILALFSLFFVLMTDHKRGDREIIFNMGTILGGLMVLPMMFLLLEKAFPRAFGFVEPKAYTKLLVYGELTHKDGILHTINGVSWKIRQSYIDNSLNETFQIGCNYALIDVGGDLYVYRTDDVEQIKKELAYVNSHDTLLPVEVMSYIAGALGILVLAFTYYPIWEPKLRAWRRRNKKTKKLCAEISDDDTSGYGSMLHN